MSRTTDMMMEVMYQSADQYGHHYDEAELCAKSESEERYMKRRSASAEYKEGYQDAIDEVFSVIKGIDPAFRALMEAGFDEELR